MSEQACPECGRPVDPATQQLCPYCSYPLLFTTPAGDEEAAAPVAREPGAQVTPEPRDPEPEPRPAYDEEPGGVTCPHCQADNPTQRVRCRRCGAALGVVSVPLELPPGPPADRPRLARDLWPAWLAVLSVLAVVLVLVGVVALRSDRGKELVRPRVRLTEVPRADVQVQAATRYPDQDGINYAACNVLDHDDKTAYASRPGKAVGATLVFRFNRRVDLRSITVVNGYAKNADVFARNGAVRELDVSTETTHRTWQLKRETKPQTLDAELGPTSGLTLTVTSVWPGTAADIVTLSGVRLEERRAKDAAEGTPFDVTCPPPA